MALPIGALGGLHLDAHIHPACPDCLIIANPRRQAVTSMCQLLQLLIQTDPCTRSRPDVSHPGSQRAYSNERRLLQRVLLNAVRENRQGCLRSAEVRALRRHGGAERWRACKRCRSAVTPQMLTLWKTLGVTSGRENAGERMQRKGCNGVASHVSGCPACPAMVCVGESRPHAPARKSTAS